MSADALTADDLFDAAEVIPGPFVVDYRSVFAAHLLRLDDDGNIDYEATMRVVADKLVTDLDAAECILELRDGDFYFIPERAKSSPFLFWDTTLSRWVQDLNNERMTGLVKEFIKALRETVTRLDLHMESMRVALVEELVGSGMTEAKARQQATSEVAKVHHARMKLARDYVRHLGQHEGAEALVKTLGKQSGVVKSEEDLDKVVTTLAVENGILDFAPLMTLAEKRWESGEQVTADELWALVRLRPHVKAHLTTLVAPVRFDPDATCREFEETYLAHSLPDAELREFMVQAMGVAVCGYGARNKLMLNSIGPKDAGKTILEEMAHKVLGMGVHTAYVAPEALLSGSGDDDADKPRPSLHRARKARLIFTSEPDGRKTWNGSLIKRLTGRDYVPTRDVYGKNVYWQARGLMLVSSNSFVRLTSSDLSALADRIACVRWPRKFIRPSAEMDLSSVPAEQIADLGLSDRLRASEQECSGFLNLMIRGFILYLVGGGQLREPASVGMERMAMQSRSSQTARWIDACIADGLMIRATHEMWAKKELGTSHRVMLKDAFTDYLAWAEDEGISERVRLGKQKFGDEAKGLATLFGDYAKDRDSKNYLDGIAWTGGVPERGNGTSEGSGWARLHREHGHGR